MIYVDESEPTEEIEAQFSHRKVTIKRQKDVRANFEMIGEIGRGKFGRVLKCRRNDGGEIFAAKFVTCTRREDRRNVEREVDIMNSLHSTKLLQLYDAYDNGRNEMCLIMEYIGGGELFDRVIDEEFVLSERACRVFMKQILEGVQYIHRSSIIHLDLKPENILCINRTGNRIKIIDFGLARRFEPEKKLQILFGTPEFVAPEIVNFEPIGYCTDMWAIGVICYVLVSGLSPFMGDTDLETMANVTIAEFDYEDEAFEKVSDEAKDFIDHLLVREKEKRSTVEESLKHPWILRESDLQRRCSQGSSLISTKENLSQQRAAWSSRDSCYYLFDSKSKTASQLYEANVCISPQLLDTLESSTQDQEQFSFFSTEEEGEAEMSDLKNQDGCSKMVDREENSELESVKDSKLQVKRGDTDRKRGLEENVDLADKSSLAEDSIEYIGLVKRPKTPLITASDILLRAEQIYESKHSNCSLSLPDLVPDRQEKGRLSPDGFAESCESLRDILGEMERCSSTRDFGEEYLEEDMILLDEDEEQKDQEPGLLEEDTGQTQEAKGQTQDVNPISIKEREENTKDVIEDCVNTESDAATTAVEDHVDRIDEDLTEQREDIKFIDESCASLAVAEDRENEGIKTSQDLSQDTHEHTDTESCQSLVQESFSESRALLPLPDVIKGEESGGKQEVQIDSPPAEDTQGVCKTYTVESGFERPSQGWDNNSSYIDSTQTVGTSLCSTQLQEENEESEGENDASESTESSSLPSESSGIFYKAEYTPPSSTLPQDTPTLLSAGNRDSYWTEFLAKNSHLRVCGNMNQGSLNRTLSSCDTIPPPRPPPPQISESKSDAKIFYQEPNKDASIKLPFGSPSIKPPSLLYQPPPVAPSLLPPPKLPSPKNPSDPLRSMPIYSEDPPESNLMEPIGSGLLATRNPPPFRSSNPSQPGETQLHRPTRPISPARPTPPTRHSVHARPSAHVRPGRTETFEQPETEISGDSPRRRKSDQVSSTISREMQNLLASIQALSSPDSDEVKYRTPSTSARNKNMDLLMDEVEAKVRFSTTQELLERIEQCPDIQHLQHIVQVPREGTTGGVRVDEHVPGPHPGDHQEHQPYPGDHQSHPGGHYDHQHHPGDHKHHQLVYPNLVRAPDLSNPEPVRCNKGPWDKYSNTLPRANLQFQPNSLTLSSLSKPSPPNPKTSPPSSPPHSKPSTTPDLLKFHGRTEENPVFSCNPKPPNQRPFLSTPSATPESVRRRRFVSLPRPSEMPSAQTHAYKYTGRVPDMLSRINPTPTEADYKCFPEFSSTSSSSCPRTSGSARGGSTAGSIRGSWEMNAARRCSAEDNTAFNYDNVRNSISDIKEDIFNLRDVISSTKDDISTTRQPLLEIFEDFKMEKNEKPVFRNSKHTFSSLNKEMEATRNTMKEIERTIGGIYNSSLQDDTGLGKYREITGCKTPFSGVNQGSVTKTKDLFEQKTMDSRFTPQLQGPRQRSFTPFSNTRSPSPVAEKRRKSSIPGIKDQQENSLSFRGRTGTGTRPSLKKRSPSPVVTGKVSSFRTRFESAPSSPLSTGSIPRSNKLKLREPHEVLPVGRTSSVTRLPAHFIPSPGSGSNTRPSVNRTRSLRNPTSPCSTDITSVEAAVDYLRSTLPRQPSRSNLVGRRMYGEPGSTNIGDMRDRSNLRTPFGLKR